jgi:Protein of unknown function (DUF3767)
MLHRKIEKMVDDKASTKNTPSDNALVGQIQTATWINYLPETFGLRAAVATSKYRWCAREASLWGIATGTAMTLHRFRMQSSVITAVNVGFASVFVVMGGSYFFCVKKRDYQEQMIALMMKFNTAEHVQEMPEQIPVDDHHPFVVPSDDDDDMVVQPQYTVATLPERKDWQTPLPTQDFKDIFKPVEPPPKK